jgi:hypothetical protein
MSGAVPALALHAFMLCAVTSPIFVESIPASVEDLGLLLGAISY